MTAASSSPSSTPSTSISQRAVTGYCRGCVDGRPCSGLRSESGLVSVETVARCGFCGVNGRITCTSSAWADADHPPRTPGLPVRLAGDGVTVRSGAPADVGNTRMRMTEQNARQNVTFPSAGREAHGYLATPSGGSGPGVLVIQEWWGLTDHIADIC